jgi:hypothetical protein
MKIRDNWRLGAVALAATVAGHSAAEGGHDALRYAYLSPAAIDDASPSMARGPIEAGRRCMVYVDEHAAFTAGDTDALATQQPANRAVLDTGATAGALALPVGINVSASNANGGLCCAVATNQLVNVNVTNSALPASSALQNASNTFGINMSSNTASLRATTATPAVSPPVQ